MKSLNISPSLTEQVYRTIADEILEGHLRTGEHLVQEQLASTLGVSRQPIQQAMALLKADGLVEEVGGRGLRVAGLDLELMRGHYDMRLVLDGYAARQAAQSVAQGRVDLTGIRQRIREIFDQCAEAVRARSVSNQIRSDEALHKLIYRMSGNPVLVETTEPNWRYLRRVMADVLRHAEPVDAIWDQHRAIMDAILAGDAETSGDLAEDHVRLAANELTEALSQKVVALTPQHSVA